MRRNQTSSNPALHPSMTGNRQQKHHQAPCVFAATAGGTAPMFIAAADFLPILQQEIVLPHIVAPAARQTIQSPRTPGTAGVRLTDVIARFVRP